MLSTTADKFPNLLSEEERKQFESDFQSTPNDDLIEEELQDGPADIALSRGKELGMEHALDLSELTFVFGAEESGRLEEALKEYLFAASIDPANIIPHYTAGILYYKLRNYQEAFTHFKRGTAYLILQLY
jgi:tetratricopeptide (TPR) repeat protein